MRNPLLAVLRAPDAELITRNRLYDATFDTTNSRIVPTPDCRYNLIRNTFETDASTHWTVTTGSLVSVGNKTGFDSHAMRLSHSGGNILVQVADPTAANMVPVNSTSGMTASIYVYHADGANRTITIRLIYGFAGIGGVMGTAATNAVSVPTATPTRISVSYTGLGVGFPVGLSVAGASMGSDLWIAKPMIENGLTATDWFSGSSTASESLPSPIWLDARSNYEASACAGISVSDCMWLVEDPRYQWVTNPWFATNDTGYSVTNCTKARITTFPLQGTHALELTATAANATLAYSVTPTNGHRVCVIAVVVNRAALTRSFQLNYDGVTIDSATVAQNGRATLQGTSFGDGGAQSIEIVVTDSLNTERYYVQHVGCTSFPSAPNNSYGRMPSSPMPEIDSAAVIRDGFTWAGTVHASASSADAGFLVSDNSDLNVLLASPTGAMAIQFVVPETVLDQATSITLGSLIVVEYRPDLTLGYSRLNVGLSSGIPYVSGTTFGDPSSVSSSISLLGSNADGVDDVRSTLYVGWNSEFIEVSLLESGNTYTVSDETVYPTFTDRIASTLGLSHANTSLNGGRANINVIQAAFFRQPLNAAMKAELLAKERWDETLLDDVTIPWRKLECIDVAQRGPIEVVS